MTEQEMQDLLNSYSLHLTSTRRHDGSRVFIAWYGELPGIVAETESRETVIRELDEIAGVVVRERAGEGLPTPNVGSTEPVAA